LSEPGTGHASVGSHKSSHRSNSHRRKPPISAAMSMDGCNIFDEVLKLPTAANLIHSKPRGRRYLYTTPGSVRYRPPCRNEPMAQVARPCLQPPISAVVSGGHCNASASLSDGVIPPRVAVAGYSVNRRSRRVRVGVSWDMSVPLGKYGRPLVNPARTRRSSGLNLVPGCYCSAHHTVAATAALPPE